MNSFFAEHYQTVYRKSLPYQKLGFFDFQDLLRNIPDISCSMRNGSFYFEAIIKEQAVHMNKLVQGQKETKRNGFLDPVQHEKPASSSHLLFQQLHSSIAVNQNLNQHQSSKMIRTKSQQQPLSLHQAPTQQKYMPPHRRREYMQNENAPNRPASPECPNQRNNPSQRSNVAVRQKLTRHPSSFFKQSQSVQKIAESCKLSVASNELIQSIPQQDTWMVHVLVVYDNCSVSFLFFFLRRLQFMAVVLKFCFFFTGGNASN